MQMSSSVSYYALRVCPRSGARAWWEAAAPPAIRALLRGRTRVELGPGEARDALAWAEPVHGWADHPLPPVYIYPAAPASAEQ
jgi:hypothetical protein